MVNFLLGVASSIVAAVVGWFVTKHVWPYFVDRVLYRGIRVGGVWEIHEIRDGAPRQVGEITLRQRGNRLDGTGRRLKTRGGQASDRRFSYKGRIAGEQVTLVFEDRQGRDFDTGTYVFRVSNSCVEMSGMATFHGKPENRIVSEQRFLKKSATPPPAS
jgi:hypothetical protein